MEGNFGEAMISILCLPWMLQRSWVFPNWINTTHNCTEMLGFTPCVFPCLNLLYLPFFSFQVPFTCPWGFVFHLDSLPLPWLVLRIPPMCVYIVPVFPLLSFVSVYCVPGFVPVFLSSVCFLPRLRLCLTPAGFVCLCWLTYHVLNLFLVKIFTLANSVSSHACVSILLSSPSRDKKCLASSRVNWNTWWKIIFSTGRFR